MGRVFQAVSGGSIYLDQSLASGGEGEIWTVVGQSHLAAKIYHSQALKQSNDKEAKLQAMVANPPSDEMVVRYGHVSIAWPNDLLYHSQGGFAGFLMPRLAKSFKIFDIYNPAQRKKMCPGYNWKYLFHTALNLATAIDALHARDYIMGDINEGNVLVNSRALVTLIDTDSYQVQDEYGTIHRCPVGKVEFTPPELQGVRFDQVDRRFEHDYFGLGVLIFLLLMEGNHPFAGKLKRENPSDLPASVYCLQQGAFPYVRNALVGPRPVAPKFDILPVEVRKLLVRCFWEGRKPPYVRPSAEEWAQVLEAAEAQLVECPRNPGHYYSNHLRQCPWCLRAGLQSPLAPAKPPAGERPEEARTAARPATAPQSTAPQTTASQKTAGPARRASAPVTMAPPVLPIIKLAVPRLIAPSKPAARSRRDWRARIKIWLRSPGGALNWQVWWLEARRYLLMGAAGGLALFLAVILTFEYPAATGTAFGLLTGALVAGLTLLAARFFARRGDRADIAIGLALLATGGYLTYALGLRAAALATMALTTHSLHPGWLFLTCSLVGLFEGGAYGNYQLLLRKRSPALATATSLALGLLPLLGIQFLGLLGLSFLAS